MALQPIIHIVCSDRHRNGKSLLSRLIIDYLLLNERDPFAIDADAPTGPLRRYFPGRTALVDFTKAQGQAKLFNIILTSPGRDYVVDLPASVTTDFFEIAERLNFFSQAQHCGFQTAVFYIIDQRRESAFAAEKIAQKTKKILFIPVRNAFIGSALQDHHGLIIDIAVLDCDVMRIIDDRRFSLWSFMMGDKGSVALTARQNLEVFLHPIMASLGDIAPAISLNRLEWSGLMDF